MLHVNESDFDGGFGPELGHLDTDLGMAPVTMAAQGLPVDLPIATPGGWVALCDLAPGDGVLTFENGVQPIDSILWGGVRTQDLGPTPDTTPYDLTAPVVIPPLTMDNPDQVILPPGQHLLIESDLADDMFGEPFVLLPAGALDGWRGVRRLARHRRVELGILRFARAQVVYAGRSLTLGCPGRRDTEEVMNLFHPTGPITLTMDEARYLMAHIVADEAGAALRALPRGLMRA